MSKALEIERRFKVADSFLDLVNPSARLEITQTYIQDDNTGVTRIRSSRPIGEDGFTCGPTVYTQTTKVFVDKMTAEEEECEISHGLYCSLLRASIYEPIKKSRLIVYDEHNQKWEIDNFDDAVRYSVGFDHLIAEIELPDRDTTVILPPWIGAEITGDKRYSNVQMAMQCDFIRKLASVFLAAPDVIQQRWLERGLGKVNEYKHIDLNVRMFTTF